MALFAVTGLRPVRGRHVRHQNLDLHVERPLIFGRAHIVPSLDLFNVSNNNTVQALQRQQNAATANNISAVVAPRVLRFGVSW